MIQQYRAWTYVILFVIVFCETGLVAAPFLPGDSLLFAAGIFAHAELGGLNPWLLFFVFTCAAFAGDNVNYQIGRLVGEKLFRNERSKLFKRSNLEKTKSFYTRYGAKAVVIARFVPVVRTFSPFVAGMGSMRFGRFLAFSIMGAVLWVSIFLSFGYFFGHTELVAHHFGMVVLGIIAISVLPILIEVLKELIRRRRAEA